MLIIQRQSGVVIYALIILSRAVANQMERLPVRILMVLVLNCVPLLHRHQRLRVAENVAGKPRAVGVVLLSVHAAMLEYVRAEPVMKPAQLGGEK